MLFDKKEIRERMRTNKKEFLLQEAEKRKQVAVEKGIPEEIVDKENALYKLVMVSGNNAIYINGGDDVLVMNAETKKNLDESEGLEKYYEVMDKVINRQQKYEFGERFVYYCSTRFAVRDRMALELRQAETPKERQEAEFAPRKKSRSL